ncbi:MAG TPA: TIGR01777 family oxidoreductase, partial [Thermoanaerobaculia bacterium]|nr:TIGR01777 family oxidoreductase [Thermoanaerobaculia bacterium]
GSMKILLTGATGFIGRRFTRLAAARAHQILPVSRRPPAGGFDWSPESLAAGVAAADAIVHLAGENLFHRRWTERQKQVLLSSRVDTTSRLAALAAERRPRAFVSASAVGYYGPSERLALDEETPPGSDFLATVCRRWEEATAAATAAGVRTVIARLGIVLGREDGALKQMLPPFKLGIGGPIGSGRQWVSWIHADEAAALLLFLLERESAAGPYNATAPNPVTMKELARTLGRVLRRPAVLPVPGFALRIALGEVADVLVSGQHVVPRRAVEEGFQFHFARLEDALRDLLERRAA